MKRKVFFLLFVLICLSSVLLSSCVPSLSYQIKKKNGFYPETEDFPYTKWTCREIDLSINMFGYAENIMTGTYRGEENVYYVIANFDIGSLLIDFFPSENVPGDPEYFPEYRWRPCGHVGMEYYYDKTEKTIVCSHAGSSSLKDETIPETLTFEKTGTFAQTPTTRWVAEGVDGLEMYLDAFDDKNDYYRGEIVIDGKKNFVQAVGIGNNFYQLFVENGKINNLKEGTTSPLVNMYFEMHDGEILATVCAKDFELTYTYWTYGDVTVTFKSQNVQK